MATARTVEELTHEIDVRRDHLELLLHELQERGRKLSRPVAFGLLGLASAALGGYFFWRYRQRSRRA